MAVSYRATKITVGTAAVSDLCSADSRRVALLILNEDTTNSVRLAGAGQTPTATAGALLAARASLSFDGEYVDAPTGFIVHAASAGLRAIAVTANTDVTVLEVFSS